MSRRTAVVVALAVVVSAGAVAYAGHPAGALPTGAGRARTVALSEVTLSCPGGQRDRQTSTSVVTVSPGQRSGGSAGTLAVAPLARAAGSALGRVHARGSLVSVPLAPQQRATVVEGRNSLAAGCHGGPVVAP